MYFVHVYILKNYPKKKKKTKKKKKKKKKEIQMRKCLD